MEEYFISETDLINNYSEVIGVPMVMNTLTPILKDLYEIFPNVYETWDYVNSILNNHPNIAEDYILEAYKITINKAYRENIIHIAKQTFKNIYLPSKDIAFTRLVLGDTLPSRYLYQPRHIVIVKDVAINTYGLALDRIECTAIVYRSNYG